MGDVPVGNQAVADVNDAPSVGGDLGLVRH